jgi:predicted nucleic acid-binding protein
MPSKFFLDTNVILDLALDRSEFVKDAEAIFTLRDQGKIDIYISAITLANVAYFAGKHKLDPFIVVGKFLDWTNVIQLEPEFFKEVLISNFLDFEDGLQYFTAYSEPGIEAIITRNAKDFKTSSIQILTPSQFLTTFGSV